MNDHPSTNPSSDDGLLTLLGQALGADEAVPDHVLEGARSAFTWRTIDAELAELVFDSARELSGVRSEESNRQVTFSAPGVEIEVMVIDEGTRRLLGQLVPAVATTIELVGSDAVQSTSSDELGRFSFDELAPGPVRLVILDAIGATTVQTEWMLF